MIPEVSAVSASSAARKLPYCESPYRYERRRTRVVMVGDVGVGGDNPIRIQSMTTTRTQDVEGTVAQAIRLVDAGCELVRITAPTVADAKAIGEIRSRLRALRITAPLVADIHFSPHAAMAAADHVEKVRINPGNYADSKSFSLREYSDAEYDLELERIEERFRPLVLKCKELGRSLRIGTNHGSLSDRVMSRYGDTPAGMVESALEFARICERHGYYDLIFSMKASNPKVMIQAYRLLVARMNQEGMAYPLHLGVTEAGNGEDGRIKSAVGIGTLLEDGLGDTIRVSLTEEPEYEIPVARALARRYDEGRVPVSVVTRALLPDHRDPYDYTRRLSDATHVGATVYGEANTVGVLLTLPDLDVASALAAVPTSKSQVKPDLLALPVSGADDVDSLRELRAALRERGLPTALVGDVPLDPALVRAARALLEGFRLRLVAGVAGLEALPELVKLLGEKALFVEVAPANSGDWQGAVDELLRAAEAVERAGLRRFFLSLRLDDLGDVVRGYRLLSAELAERGRRLPLLLRYRAEGEAEAVLLETSTCLGSLLCDGMGDLVEVAGERPAEERTRLAFNVLQAASVRFSKAEFVACPSCGRTLFDLQPVTDRIKAKTGHLTGVKIAIMGCVVNGPGEMADAHFGYVGGGPGRVNLYVGKQVVEKNIPSEVADERLIDLIKSHGKWTEPPAPGE